MNCNTKILPHWRCTRLLCLALLWLVPLSGCGKPQPVAQHTDDHKKEEAGVYLPGSVQGTGWHIPWSAKDPKHPHAPPVKMLVADARNGAMARQDDNIVLRLQHVHSTLYQQGKPAALVDANIITTDRNSKLVIGTGGVTVTSLTTPPDTVITADKMTWNPDTGKVIATGNVHARQRRPNGQPATDSRSDRMEYDLKTGRLKG